MISPRRSKRSALPGGWHNWLLAILCVAVIAFAVSSIGSSSADSASTQRTATVGRGVVQSTVSGNGSLEAAQQVELNFGASGEVTEIYVKAGEEVAQGEVLARIDSSSAQASLASAKAQLSEAEETLESAEESEEEEVSTSFDQTATTVLASYQPEGLSEASDIEAEEGRSEKGQSETEEPAGSQTNPGEKEKEEGAASEEEAASAAPSEPAASEPAAGGEESSPQGATVSVATAEANLREAQLSVKSARQEVRETTLLAPISGTIASVSGAVGESVSGESSGASSAASGGSESSSALGAFGGESSSSSSSGSESSSAFIVLSQLHRLKMEVSFSESDIGKIKVGQPATVAISSMEGTELAGKITAVDVLPAEGSSSVVEYPATITLTQNAKGVRAGMSASAEVVVEEVKNAVTVTSEAITSGPSKTVTVKESGGKEVQKTVTTGLAGDESTQIVSGLKPGETVVLPEVTVATGGGEASGGLPELGAGGGGFPSGGFPSGGFPGAP